MEALLMHNAKYLEIDEMFFSNYYCTVGGHSPQKQGTVV